MALLNTGGFVTNLPAILGGTPIFENNVPISSSTLPDISQVMYSFEDIFDSGMITNHKYVRLYEDKMAKYLGAQHAVAVSSATSGLLLMLKCMDLEGEVILPSFTFSVTGHVLAWTGLTPKYVDIDPNTCLIDPAEVEKAITPKTCAIFGVHIWGNPCNHQALQEISDRYNIKLIYDAAQATGSKYMENPIGALGEAQVFSCSPTKVVTAAEGGILTTNNADLAEKVRIGRNYGDDGSYDCQFEGINARMSEFHAALGLATLDMAEEHINRRHDIYALYKKYLSQLSGIRFPSDTYGGTTNGIYFSIIIDESLFGLTRDHLYEALKHDHVDSRRYYTPPLHLQKANLKYAGLYKGKLPNTESIANRSLTLPVFSHMTDEQVIGVCTAISRIAAQSEAVSDKLSNL